MRVVGLSAGQRIEVAATTDDVEGRRWRASASFIAGRTGVVDLGRQSPLWGDYAGPDAMGLFWSMGCADRDASFAEPVDAPQPVSIEVRSGDGVVAFAHLDRPARGPGVVRTDVRDEGLVGALFAPASVPAPAVLVLAGPGDGVPERTAALLASHGFTTLALACARSAREIPLEYFERGAAWLLARRSVAGDRLAVLGTSRGGELALLLGAMYPAVGAVVAIAPSGVVHAASDGRRGLPPTSPWSRRGRPVPCLEAARRDDAAAVEAATIPVERVRGPVLVVSGGADRFWPTRDAAEVAVRRGGSRVEHLFFPAAGHGIAPPFRPTASAADAEAGERSWRRVLGFLTDAAPAR
jgi:dienelactone hydrolase